MARIPKELELSLKMNQIPVDKITVTVDLKITRLFHIRLWIGIQLLWLLATLWDCELDVEYKEDPSRLVEVKR